LGSVCGVRRGLHYDVFYTNPFNFLALERLKSQNSGKSWSLASF
jgi:hypothetical protein